ncbi:hypothetical protein ALQ76_05464 [Pseudomonas syringae pv. atrofaciens]|nr:hypothetical protein ALQ76_05464 [Pseudomonas syringae pv. atrofaciens]
MHAEITLVITRYGSVNVIPAGGEHWRIGLVGQVLAQQCNAPAAVVIRQCHAGVPDAVSALFGVRVLADVVLHFALPAVIGAQFDIQAIVQRDGVVGANVAFPVRAVRQGFTVDVAGRRRTGRAGEAVDACSGVGQRPGEFQVSGGLQGVIQLDAFGTDAAGVDQARHDLSGNTVEEIRLIVVVLAVEHRQVGGQTIVPGGGLEADFPGVRGFRLEGLGVARLHVEEHVVGRAFIAARVGDVGHHTVAQVVLQTETPGLAVFIHRAGTAGRWLNAADGRSRCRHAAMIVFQIVMGPACPGNRSQVRCEVERGFTEHRITVGGGAVVGDAAILSCRCDQRALIGLVALAVHVKQTADVFDKLAFRRRQTQLLGILVERQIALVFGAGERRSGSAKPVAVLILRVVPAAPGGDGGQGVVAQLPVELTGQAFVDVLDMAAVIADDIAVIAVGTYRRQGTGEGRGQRLGYHPVGRVVMGLHVVRCEGEGDVVIGREFQLAACALAVVAVDFLTIELVIDIAVIAAEQRRDRAFEGLRNQAAANAETGAAFIAAVIRLIDVTVSLFGRCLGGDVEHARRSVLAEQRALRAAQHFDAFQVEQIQRGLTRTRIHHTIDHRGHRRFDAWRGGNGADTANEQRSVLVGSPGAEIQRWHLLHDAGHAITVIALQLFTLDHGHGDRYFLQRFFAACGGHGHRFQRYCFCVLPCRCLCHGRNTRQCRQPHQQPPTTAPPRRMSLIDRLRQKRVSDAIPTCCVHLRAYLKYALIRQCDAHWRLCVLTKPGPGIRGGE